MVAMLSIVIGIVFVILLFSLLATTVMELLAGLLALRGKHLLKAIGDMLGDWTEQFRQHPYYKQLANSSNPGTSRPNPPSYIGSGTFAAILGDLLRQNDGESLDQKINALPEGALKSVLLFLYNETSGDFSEFKAKTEEWFNEVMDRASGAYKKKTKSWLVAVGLVIAVTFNVDPLDIYTNLSLNATLREYIAGVATEYVNTQPAPADTLNLNAGYNAARQQLDSLINNNIASISQPLGLGWGTIDFAETGPKWWLLKILGWVTTALAISLGASFWFDLLRQLVSLRSSGPAPAQGSGGLSSGGSFLTKPGSESALESVKKKSAIPPK